MERLSSDLSNLAFEQKQERLEWRRAMEAQSAEIEHLLERQNAMQVRQDELETIAIEIEEQLQGDVRDLTARLQTLSDRLDRLEQGQDRQVDALGDLKAELKGLSQTTDEVFDDIADRVGVFEKTLAEFDRTLSKQYEVLTEGLSEARDQLTEGLAEALEAAEGHADGIIELKDAIATYQERRDELDATSREQLAAMREQLDDERATLASRHEGLEKTIGARMDEEAARVQELARRQGEEAARLQSLDTALSARLASQAEATHALDVALRTLREQGERERETLNQLVSQLAAQGAMLAQALESVQAGSIQAEEQMAGAMREQFEALLDQLQSSTSAWHSSLAQTQAHFKEFEAKVAKALGLQRNENLEHERHLLALKDDLAVLSTRVGTIVQLLTKASRPSVSAIDPS